MGFIIIADPLLIQGAKWRNPGNIAYLDLLKVLGTWYFHGDLPWCFFFEMVIYHGVFVGKK